MTPGMPSLVVAAAAAGLLSFAVAEAQIARPVPVRPPVGGFNPGLPPRSTGDLNGPLSQQPAGTAPGLGAPTGTPTTSGNIGSGESVPGVSGETVAEQPLDETAAEAIIDEYLSRHDLIAALPAVEKARAIRRDGD